MFHVTSDSVEDRRSSFKGSHYYDSQLPAPVRCDRTYGAYVIFPITYVQSAYVNPEDDVGSLRGVQEKSGVILEESDSK